MRDTCTVLTIGLFLAMVSMTGYAHEPEHENAYTASLADSWSLLLVDQEDIKAKLDTGDARPLHDLGLRMQATVKGLARHKDEIAAENLVRFESYANQLSTLAGKLHEAGEGGDLEAGKKTAAQIDGMMILLAGVIPAAS